MTAEKNNRTKLLQARLTPQEDRLIRYRFSQTSCRKLSDYVRKMLLDKPITVKMRNQSLDDLMAELVILRRELNAIGNNYNQVVKRLHTLRDFREIKTWLLLNESSQQILLKKVEEIKLKITQINDQWLQS
jgi:hypothetical protein